MTETRRYYHSYEDRYAAVYGQGAEYWTTDPDEIRDTTTKLQEFLDRWAIVPPRARVLEFGCGEGHLARHLIERGYDYRGLDVSPSALAKARVRVADLDARPQAFTQDDVTSLPAACDGTFDATIDNFCLHMLVTDGDRRRYLAAVHRALKPGGMAYFHENHSDHPVSGPMTTFEEYMAASGFRPGVVDERTVYVDGEKRTIRLARVPFRAKDENGYHRELSAAGLQVRHFALDGAGHCVFHAARQTE
ncbi:MAG: class I SAM-dependent methyltransferase [Planctomycetes bacterium]|nr:class I SAM-dependent methyltransferase [Planctomycetota bacterium]